MGVYYGKDLAKKHMNVIPPMAVGVCGGNDNMTKLVANYWPVYKMILENEKTKKYPKWVLQVLIALHVLTFKWQKVKENTLSHAFVYFGGGKNEVIETALSNISWMFFKIPHGQIKSTDLKDKLHDDNWITVYANSKMTVEGMQRGKDFGYGSIGVPYDLQALYGFIDVDKDHDWKEGQICTESTANIIRRTGVELVPEVTNSKIHPEQLREWLESDVAKEAGWKKICTWNGPKKEFVTYV